MNLEGGPSTTANAVTLRSGKTTQDPVMPQVEVHEDTEEESEDEVEDVTQSTKENQTRPMSSDPSNSKSLPSTPDSLPTYFASGCYPPEREENTNHPFHLL